MNPILELATPLTVPVTKLSGTILIESILDLSNCWYNKFLLLFKNPSFEYDDASKVPLAVTIGFSKK